MMDLAALRALVAVDVTGSVAGAADDLGFTPSAVSQQINRLERAVGVPLLERAGRGVVLTRNGRSLVEDGRDLLAAVEQAESRARRLDGALTGRLRVVSFPTAVRGVVAPTLACVAVSAPDLVVTLEERDPADGVAAVASGQADLGVVHNWLGVPLHLPPTVDAQDLATDIADVLVPRDHRLARRRKVRPADLLDEPWVSTGPGTICHSWFLQMYAGFARPPRVAYWAGEFASHVALVAQGLAVALVPRLGRGSLPDEVVALSVVDPVPQREVQAVWRRTQGHDPALRHVVDAIAAGLGGSAV